MKDPYAEIELHISRTIDYLSAVVGAKTDADYGELHRQILTALDAQMQTMHPGDAAVDHITADQVVLHVADRDTGHMYSRILPLEYQENSNGITLCGEDFQGKESKIVFLSNTAVDKIHDLMGRGADQSPCKDDE